MVLDGSTLTIVRSPSFAVPLWTRDPHGRPNRGSLARGGSYNDGATDERGSLTHSGEADAAIARQRFGVGQLQTRILRRQLSR